MQLKRFGFVIQYRAALVIVTNPITRCVLHPPGDIIMCVTQVVELTFMSKLLSL